MPLWGPLAATARCAPRSAELASARSCAGSSRRGPRPLPVGPLADAPSRGTCHCCSCRLLSGKPVSTHEALTDLLHSDEPVPTHRGLTDHSSAGSTGQSTEAKAEHQGVICLIPDALAVSLLRDMRQLNTCGCMRPSRQGNLQTTPHRPGCHSGPAPSAHLPALLAPVSSPCTQHFLAEFLVCYATDMPWR